MDAHVSIAWRTPARNAGGQEESTPPEPSRDPIAGERKGAAGDGFSGQGRAQSANAPTSRSLHRRFFRAKQLGIPAARWGVAVGSIGFFLLYEELPQLILQSQYGIFPGYKDVLVSFGLMTQKRANAIDAMMANPDYLNRPAKDPKPED